MNDGLSPVGFHGLNEFRIDDDFLAVEPVELNHIASAWGA